MSVILYAYYLMFHHSSIHQFSPHIPSPSPPSIPSTHDRLVGEVHATLYVILKHCLSFDPFIEEIMDHIRNKKEAPHGRVCMMEFIAVACFEVHVCVCVCVCLFVYMHMCCCFWFCVCLTVVLKTSTRKSL